MKQWWGRVAVVIEVKVSPPLDDCKFCENAALIHPFSHSFMLCTAIEEAQSGAHVSVMLCKTDKRRSIKS